MIDCDVLVVGGGPAGTSLALCLARQNRKVVILEKHNRPEFKVGESLVPAANDILKKLDMWDIISNQGHLPSYGNRWAWGSSQLGYNDFIHLRQGHGWHLDRNFFDHQLLEEAQNSGAKLIKGYQLKNVQNKELFKWHAELQKGEEKITVETRFIADASGRVSVLARNLGLTRSKGDGLIALWGIFQPRNGHSDLNSTTLVESDIDGWFHISLLPSGNKIVSFFTDYNHPNIKYLKTKSFFLSKISNTLHVSKSLQNYKWFSPVRPKGESAESSRLQKIAGSDWISVGDAAMTFDPLSSQGIPNALFSGREAAKAVEGALSGESDYLKKYVDTMDGIWKRYQLRIKDLYRGEKRWPNSFFWNSRLG